MSDQTQSMPTPFSLGSMFKLPDRAGSLFMAMAIYIGAVLLANQWATEVVQFTRDGLKLKNVYDFPMDMAIGPQNGLIVVGTVVFGITFTQRDRVHRAGRAWVYLMLIVTTILAVFGIAGAAAGIALDRRERKQLNAIASTAEARAIGFVR